jgi:hypothetical protein
MMAEMIREANLLASLNTEIAEKWSLFFVQKGFLGGLNFFREYVKSTGWNLHRLEIVYCQCNFPLEKKWQEVVDNVPKEKITAVTISDTIDENPEDRAKQIRIGGKAYQILQQKAAAAEMTVSKYLELLIGGTEPSDDEDCGEEEGEGKELTPEKEEILDDLEKSWLKTKPAAGFGNKKPSKNHQKPSKSYQLYH